MSRMDTQTETKLLSALWQTIAEHGWDGLTMAGVAAAADMPLAQLRRRCPTRLHLLRMYGRALDAAVLEAGTADQHGTPRDRIFDVLMRRIDAMQPHRAGLLRLFDDVKRNPLLALLLLAALPRSMAWMLESAGLSPAGLPGLLRVKGTTAVWLATLRAWTDDETQDLAPTMAALDKALDQAERLAQRLGIGPGDASASAEPA